MRTLWLRGKSGRLRKLLTGLIVAAIAAAVPIIGATAAQAAGGCSTYSVTSHGYSIGICINDRNSGTKAYPDYYVNNTLPSSCVIKVEVWDNNNHRFGPVFQGSSSCAKGHHPSSGSWCISNWDPAEFGTILSVHAYFRLYINGTQVNNTSTNSPSISVNYTGMASC